MFKADKKKILSYSGAFLLGLVILAAAFYSGYNLGLQKTKTIVVSGVGNAEQGKPKGIDFSLFWETWLSVKDKYVDAAKVKDQDLLYGAISGLVNSLKDQNSSFFPPSDAKKFGEDISGEFSGIGAEIGIRNDQLVIVAPLKDSPAERAGIKAGDKIMKVDDTFTTNLSVEDAVKIIRGERGTVVKLLISRDDWSSPKEIPIKRDIIQLPTIDFEMKGDFAYIHLYNFFEKAPFQFFQTAIKVAVNNPKGIILDLRNNPGGYLEAGVNITSWFLEPGTVVVRERFRIGEDQVFKAQGTGLFKSTPIVILVNQGSASASEILTGALKDNRNVKVIGKKTFGKGTVQELVNLTGEALLKITIAHWITPNGHQIDKNGIEPDYDIDFKEEDAEAGRDPQLEKAIEVLKSEIKESNFELKIPALN